MGSVTIGQLSYERPAFNSDFLDFFKLRPNTRHQAKRFSDCIWRACLPACIVLALIASMPPAVFGAKSVAVSAALTSPAPGSVLPGSAATFTITAASGITQYQLWLGTTPGASNLGVFSTGSTTASTVSFSTTGLPTNGTTIYALLYWSVKGSWSFASYTFTAASSGVPALSGLHCATNSMTGTGTDACTVTLNVAALSGGFAVSLASNNSNVTVPASVTVAAGATSASFTATVTAVSTATTVTLTATAGTVSKTFAIQLGAETPTLGVSATSLSFGNQSVNSATTQTLTLSSTGTAAVTISAETISGAGFTVSGATFPLTLNPNQTATLTVQFDPTAAGAVTGSLKLTSNSSTGTTTTVNLSGTGVPVLTGLTCTNGSFTGAGTDSCTVTLNAAAATGGFAVSLASNSSNVTVPASVTVAAGATSATFTATVTAVSTATTVTLTATAGTVSKTFAISLGSSGTTLLSVNATTIAFGDVTLDSAATQSVTLTSTGTSPVTVSAATVLGTGYSVSGPTLPVTLSTNQTTTLTVQFDPTTAASDTGTLTIVSTSTINPTDVVTLTGTGVATAYQVNLSWDAPTSSPDPVAGYNVYRAPSGSTSYQQVNTSEIPTSPSSWTDTNVQTGQTYDYIVESVDAEGNTSAPSNMASVTVP